MRKNNPFEGDSIYAKFARAIYKRVKSREWFAYADVMAEHLKLQSAEELPYSISKCDDWLQLKKAFNGVISLIEMHNDKDCFEITLDSKDKRKKRFRYIGKEEDPLANFKYAKMTKNLKKYWQFCQASEGFLPLSWLEYFFRDSMDLLEIKTKRGNGKHVLSVSIDRILKNIDLLPFLYESILNRQVLEIDYKSYKDKEKKQCVFIFSPHYLKEFNGRWFLLGHVDGMRPELGFNIAIDRIVDKPRNVANGKYVPAPDNFYENYFNDIVGVSHNKNSKVEEIYICAHTYYMYNLIETKKFHHSQKVIKPFGMYDNGEYGVFAIKAEVNNELIGRILQMGKDLEVTSPNNVRALFKQRVSELNQRYESDFWAGEIRKP